MEVSQFDYYLPEELIAQTPVEPRDAARLFVLHRETGEMEHRIFRDLVAYLRRGDVLVMNDTRVIPARLRGEKRGSGGKVEVLLLHPVSGKGDDQGELIWKAMVKPGRRLSVGTVIDFPQGLWAEVIARTPSGERVLRFQAPGSFLEVLEKVGEVPLPPYIHEPLKDPERYQTVYAEKKGSAAAPTAGLHFTPRLLAELEAMGVQLARVTLHVGPGTFQPVRVARVEDHVMHTEYYQVSPETAMVINKARQAGGRIVAVGTTSVRTLETVATPDGVIEPKEGWTELFIYPGYRFKGVDALITNFHLPKSTLLMLVSAFAGYELIMQAYREAVARRYRFFSFGDAMLIL